MTHRQIYTYISPEGANTHIDSEGLYSWTQTHASELEIFSVPLDHSLAQRFIRENTVSQQRIWELLSKPTLTPVIFCKDGTFTEGRPDVLLVDGHHRYVLGSICRAEFIPGFVLEEAQWRPFQLEGLPPLTKAELQAIPLSPRSY